MSKSRLSVPVATHQPGESSAGPGAGRPDEPDRVDTVAVTVNGNAIYVSQIQREMDRALGTRQMSDEARDVLRAEAMEQLVKQQVVLAYLTTRGEAASETDIDFALGQLTEQLARQDKTLGDYRSALGLSEIALRESFRWQLSWKAYLDKYLTEENAQRYFEKHHSEFDGTRIRVSQILIKIDGEDPDGQRVAIGRAKTIRSDIVSEAISFVDAARRYSDSPTGPQGGDLGWISRNEPMPDSFSRAAYQLKLHEISQPVVSAFGVHLIRCVEIQPGQKTWQESRGPIQAAITRYLFDWTVARQRPEVDIQYTGAVTRRSDLDREAPFRK